MKLKYIYILSIVLAGMIYTLISLGGLVRSAGAGLSCPDWPLCHGQVVPTQMFSDDVHPQPQAMVPGHNMSVVATHATGFQIFLEWFHRLIAGSVSIGLILIAFFVFKDKTLRVEAGKITILAFVFLAAQIILGGLTVLGLLSPKWVSSHLAVGLAFFCCVVWIMLSIGRVVKGQRTVTQKGAWHLLVFAIVFGQAVLGGLVSSNYAGLACTDFPTCNGMWIPEFTGLVRFQFLHRLGAVIATVTLVMFAYKTMKARLDSRKAKLGSLLIPFFLMLQILLGVGMIFMKLPLLMSVAHLAVAAALIGTVLVITHEYRYSNRNV